MADAGGPIESWSELVARVCSTLLRPDLAAECEGWIQLAEAEIFRDCDVKAGDQTKSGTLSAGAESLDLPTGCLEVRAMSVADGSRNRTLTAASLDEIVRRRNQDTSGVPFLFHQFGETLELAPVANGTGTQAYKLWYYGTPEPLSNYNQRNLLLDLGPDAYLYGALKHGAIRIANPERQALYEPQFERAKGALTRAYWRSRLPGKLEMRTDFSVDDRHTSYS